MSIYLKIFQTGVSREVRGPWRHNKFINILRLNDKKRYKEWDSMKSYSYLLLLAIKDDLIQFILSILNFKKD